MARPIEHGLGSTATVSAWETLKGAAGGLLASAAVGAIVLGAVGAAISIFPGIALGSAVAWGAGIGAVSGAVEFGGPAMIIGSLVGLFRGGSRVSKENAAYNDEVVQVTRGRENQSDQALNNAATVGMQQGYMQGAQEGVQIGYRKAVAEMQAAQQQQAEAAAAEPASKSFAAAMKPPAVSKVQTLEADRAAAAASQGRGA